MANALNTPLHPFLAALQAGIVLSDGAMGTLLYDRGAPMGTCLDELNMSNRALVQRAHLDYILAGARVVQTNTFSANRIRLADFGLEQNVWEINLWGAKIARAGREIAGEPVWVAGSVGPLGKAIHPLGPIDPAQAEAAFREQMEALLAGGVDLFIIETMSDTRELLLAAQVARSLCRLPIVAEVTFSQDGETLFGATVETVLDDLFDTDDPPFDVFGINCGAGPFPVLSAVERVAAVKRGSPPDSPLVKIPISAIPNAGHPKRVGDRYVYLSPPSYFAGLVERFVASGVRLLGGCCGTTPQHTAAMRSALDRATTQATDHPFDAAPNLPLDPNPEDVSARPSVPFPSGPSVPPHERSSVRLPEPFPGHAGAPSSGQLAEGAPQKSPRSEKTETFLDRLAQGHVISVELDPPRGSQVGKYLRDAKLLHEAGVDTINVADSPMGRVRMSSLAGAQLVAQATGLSPIVHYTTRDRNLMGIQSDLLGAHALGIRNVLALTGDAPGLGNYAHATAVFDVDSIGLIEILAGLNEGRDLGGNPIGKPTRFTIGAALNLQAEDLDRELSRFRLKLAAGAQFIMTQPLYEIEPFLRVLDRLGGIPLPVLLGIMPLHSLKHAEYLHNEVPGIAIPAHVMRLLTKAGDDGERVGLELAAQVIEQAAGSCAGFYLAPSFGKCEGIAVLVRMLREEWQEAWVV